MKTTKQVQQENKGLILAFQVGRGGRFNNSGHLTYIGEKHIGEFTDNLFTRFENQSDFQERYGWDNTFSDQKSILELIADKDFSELGEKFGISEEDLGEEIYHQDNGNDVSLSVLEAESGLGTIDLDGEFDTVYTIRAEDLGECEIDAIVNSSNETGYFGEFSEEINLTIIGKIV